MTAAARTGPSFRGTYTALVTPIRDQAIDWQTLDALVERQIEAGIDGVVPCGSTGESATLSHDEHDLVIETVVRRVAGRCKVLAGTGSNNTAEAVRLTQHAEKLGVDGALVVTPYYNRPTQDGMFQHFCQVAAAVNFPIVLYNVPSRCAVDLANETVRRLHGEHANIVAIKDASGGIDRVAELAGPIGIDVLCGDDTFTLPMMALGAVGVISVISNLTPEWMKQLVDAAAAGDFERARACHHKACGLAEAIGMLGPNPLPLKAAMAIKGLLCDEYRLPLCSMGPQEHRILEETLKRFELL